ncbi:hypothetical protein BP5796_04684 [Coleophoma crateriformis]|uniref:Uncharacterized protein n=1 Tax=Coleophoma crateriformis TaxID=565419 RepID=A0A3D8SA85_9HELO|nr:hypothetical protein BP5796_04684 [Coleophoma crateriformis]
MSSAVAELETGLQAMLSLKPPGVTGSRIQSITALCKANVQSESVLIQKLFTHFKKAPGTHKLGVLYVVDSVTREWMVQAKAAGQPINSSATDGTYAAGVNRVKELLPVLMNDIIQSAPADQKEKIKKLVDIWEKGQTFPLQMLLSFKEKLSASTQNRSTTPDGSPPPDLQARLGLHRAQESSTMQSTTQTPAPAAAPNTASILAALVNIARQNTSASPGVSNSASQPSLLNGMHVQNNTPAPAPAIAQPVNTNASYPSYPPPVNLPAPTTTFALPGQNGLSLQQPASSLPLPYPPVQSIAPPPAAGLDPQTAMLVKMLAERGVAPEQIAGIMAAAPSAPVQYGAQIPNQVAQNGSNGRSEDSRDRNGYHDRDSVRSPSRFRRRSRSPSPARGWNARGSPASRRRDDLNEFFRGRETPVLIRGEDREGRGGHGRGNDYRQRSPPRRRGRSPTPPNRDNYSGGRKWIDFDPSIPKGSIKVLSRTLFVGGVNSSEPELRSAFEHYGTVQTCIVNKDKRHAFVKMLTRADAVTAKETMEQQRAQDMQGRNRSFNQTRWGVGFGPRDCSDYATGISVIPISKLTDADRKWMVTAEYGGTGGKPIESGMVVEEPDIEIGQGVSSKAISRRMQSDRGGSNGSRSTRDRDEDDGPRFRRSIDRDEGRDNDRRDFDRNDKLQNTPAGVSQFSMAGMPGFTGFPGGVPSFPMTTLPNGMPMFPPPMGFAFPPNQTPPQPPPPGRD